jgi:DNA helicase-2/ATP-dependent DNA helicase PcrA
MLKKDKREEDKYLFLVINEINMQISNLEANIDAIIKKMKDLQSYYIENFNEIDPAEQASVRLSLDLDQATLNHYIKRKEQTLKFLDSPYFGRVDFLSTDLSKPMKIYIGIHNFDSGNTHYIYDWRAPISSLFYNFEKGAACSYTTPSGEKTGFLTLKRQYRIRRGSIEYILDSSLLINDDILQFELSKTSSNKMRNIISSIQQEQNVIIRDEDSDIMLIQGVAGSGKTSIALHRAAYLLYRFKETLKAENILIISPNKVFANYISNVLPELGEENLTTLEMGELAETLIEGEYKFQSFSQQVDILAKSHAKEDIDNIRYKSSFEFSKNLEDYILDLKNNIFVAKEVSLDTLKLAKDFVVRGYKKTGGKSIFERVERITDYLFDDFEHEFNIRLKVSHKRKIRHQVKAMFKILKPMQVYTDFFKHHGREDLAPRSNKYLDYADVFPYLYVKSLLEKIEPPQPAKYLIIDEMQDYSPIQYKLLNDIFDCQMTILGDSSQAVNPYSMSDAETLIRIFPYATSIELNNSYRSTREIMSFALRVIPNDRLVTMERYGEPVKLEKCKNHQEMMLKLSEIINDFNETNFKSLGIICKTQDQADLLYTDFSTHQITSNLINQNSKAFGSGVIVVSATMSKGLEFDQVAIVSVDNKNYAEEIDKYLLYVACTRAMHKLTILYYGTKSDFLT